MGSGTCEKHENHRHLRLQHGIGSEPIISESDHFVRAMDRTAALALLLHHGHAIRIQIVLPLAYMITSARLSN